MLIAVSATPKAANIAASAVLPASLQRCAPRLRLTKSSGEKAEFAWASRSSRVEFKNRELLKSLRIKPKAAEFMPLRSLSDKSDAVEFWRALAAVSLSASRFEFAAVEFSLFGVSRLGRGAEFSLLKLEPLKPHDLNLSPSKPHCRNLSPKHHLYRLLPARRPRVSEDKARRALSPNFPQSASAPA